MCRERVPKFKQAAIRCALLTLSYLRVQARLIGLVIYHQRRDVVQPQPSQKTAAAVDKDIADSRSAMVTGTPTYFINGKRVMQRDFQTFQRMIEEALSGKAPAAS